MAAAQREFDILESVDWYSGGDTVLASIFEMGETCHWCAAVHVRG